MSAAPRPDPLDQLAADARRRIEQYGYTMNIVGTGECAVPGCTCRPSPHPYAYSLGLVQYHHPEVVMFGVPRSHVNALADPVFEAAAAGRPLAVGREHRHVLPGGLPISLVPVPDQWVRRDLDRIGGWLNVYAEECLWVPPFLQICWPDHDGHMPWEPACDPHVTDVQPLLADDPLRYPKPSRRAGRHPRR